MLHSAADSEQNPNNSNTRVGGEVGICHLPCDSPPTFTPVLQAATSLLPPCGSSLHPTVSHLGRVMAAALLHSSPSQLPHPNSSTGWDQDGTKTVSANLSSATYQQRGFIHSFLHPFIPWLGTAVNNTRPLPPEDLH